jgi:hypothetical protein
MIGGVLAMTASYGQVIVAQISPNPTPYLQFETASGWGLDMSIAGNFVEDTVVVAIDSLACAPLTNDLTGKIALIYRGSCEFGAKALEAENAGAVGVIIINNQPAAPIPMGAGAVGASVTIPVVMMTQADGVSLRSIMQSNTLVMRFGNKSGYYQNDLGSFAAAGLRANFGSKPAALAQNASELTVAFGCWAYNYGANDQVDVSLNTIVKRNGTQVYNQVSSLSDINSGDSAYFTTTDMALSSYLAGDYTVQYIFSADGVVDDYPADDTASYIFNLGDLWSLAHATSDTTVASDGFYRNKTLPTTQFEACIVLNDANASRVATDGVYYAGFAIGNADTATVSLEGFEVTASIYEWNDADITETNGAFDNLVEVANGDYVYPTNATEETIFIPISDINTSAPYYYFADGQNYLVCINSFEPKLYLGFSTTDHYNKNIAGDDQLRVPFRTDGLTWSVGFADYPVPSIALHTATDLNVNENVVEANAYPNPSKDVITVKVNANGDATLKVTDLAGRTVSNGTVKINNGQFTTNVAGMNSGTYVFSLEFANGTSSRFNVVVTK